MCTAISYRGDSHYFGRNLDLEFCYQEQVVIMPRKMPFPLRNGSTVHQHYAMIGMATVSDGYPLFYEATNECGLSIAGLNFPDHAAYHPKAPKQDNITPYELIPWLLCSCASADAAVKKLRSVNLWNLPFSREYPLSPLHWLVADSKHSFVIEPMGSGIDIYENPLGVLTNNPPFPYHLYHAADYLSLSPVQTKNCFSHKQIQPYSNGMGAIGLPGDWSSASRFIRAAFANEHAVSAGSDISQFFHLLSAVAMPSGCIRLPNGKLEITQYSCCVDTSRGLYYYTTYNNSRITGIDMHRYPLDSDQLISFPLRKEPDIYFES